MTAPDYLNLLLTSHNVDFRVEKVCLNEKIKAKLGNMGKRKDPLDLAR